MAALLPDVIDEEILCCPLCLCSYQEPKILPCLHIFCRMCLQRYMEKTCGIKLEKPKIPPKPPHLSDNKNVNNEQTTDDELDDVTPENPPPSVQELLEDDIHNIDQSYQDNYDFKDECDSKDTKPFSDSHGFSDKNCDDLDVSKLPMAPPVPTTKHSPPPKTKSSPAKSKTMIQHISPPRDLAPYDVPKSSAPMMKKLHKVDRRKLVSPTSSPRPVHKPLPPLPLDIPIPKDPDMMSQEGPKYVNSPDEPSVYENALDANIPGPRTGTLRESDAFRYVPMDSEESNRDGRKVLSVADIIESAQCEMSLDAEIPLGTYEDANFQPDEYIQASPAHKSPSSHHNTPKHKSSPSHSEKSNTLPYSPVEYPPQKHSNPVPKSSSHHGGMTSDLPAFTSEPPPPLPQRHSHESSHSSQDISRTSHDTSRISQDASHTSYDNSDQDEYQEPLRTLPRDHQHHGSPYGHSSNSSLDYHRGDHHHGDAPFKPFEHPKSTLPRPMSDQCQHKAKVHHKTARPETIFVYDEVSSYREAKYEDVGSEDELQGVSCEDISCGVQGGTKPRSTTVIQGGATCGDICVDKGDAKRRSKSATNLLDDVDFCNVDNEIPRHQQNIYTSSPTKTERNVFRPGECGDLVRNSRHSDSSVCEITFPCPSCGVNTLLPNGGITDIKTCNFIKSLQDVVLSQSSDHKKCGNCETKQANFKCLTCNTYFCRACSDAHNWLKVTKGHKLMTLKQLQSGKFQKEIQKSHAVFCDCNPQAQLPLTHVCATCDKVICTTCFNTTHADHTCSAIECVARRDQDYISSIAESMDDRSLLFNAQNDKLIAYESSIKESKDELKKKIKEQKDKLISMVEHCYKELNKEIDHRYDSELSKCAILRKTNVNTVQGIQHAQKISRQLVKHGKDVDMVTMATHIRNNFNRLAYAKPCELNTKFQIDFEPAQVTEEHVLPRLGRAVQRKNPIPKLQNQMKVFMQERRQRPDEELKMIYMFKAKTSDDKFGCKPTGVTILSDDSIAVVDDINKKVKVFNQSGKMKMVICPKNEHALIDPWDVTMTTYGNYAVTDRRAGKVKIFDKDGDFVSDFGPHLKAPWGIACNSEGDLIVTDLKEKAVYLHDSNGNLKCTLTTDVEPNLFLCPEYVTVNVNNDIIVSDFEKHCITVFDSIGRFLFKFGRKGRGMNELNVPLGVTTDRFGNILVADFNNQRIVQLDANGRFHYYALTLDDGVTNPQTIAVDRRGHLIVVDGSNIKRFSFQQDKIYEDQLAPERPLTPKVEPGKQKSFDLERPVSANVELPELPPVPKPRSSLKTDLELPAKTADGVSDLVTKSPHLSDNKTVNDEERADDSFEQMEIENNMNYAKAKLAPSPSVHSKLSLQETIPSPQSDLADDKRIYSRSRERTTKDKKNRSKSADSGHAPRRWLKAKRNELLESMKGSKKREEPGQKQLDRFAFSQGEEALERMHQQMTQSVFYDTHQHETSGAAVTSPASTDVDREVHTPEEVKTPEPTKIKKDPFYSSLRKKKSKSTSDPDKKSKKSKSKKKEKERSKETESDKAKLSKVSVATKTTEIIKETETKISLPVSPSKTESQKAVLSTSFDSIIPPPADENVYHVPRGARGNYYQNTPNEESLNESMFEPRSPPTVLNLSDDGKCYEDVGTKKKPSFETTV